MIEYDFRLTYRYFMFGQNNPIICDNNLFKRSFILDFLSTNLV